MRIPTLLRAIIVATATAAVLLAAACGGEDRPGVDVIDDGSSSGSSTGSVTGEPVGPGVVEPKPEDAEQVDVTLQEWAIGTSETEVDAGKIYFRVDNKGPEDAHEFLVIRTDLDPLSLPTEDGKVPEDQVDIIGEIEPFTPDSRASMTLDLPPGHYVLICNIVEQDDDEIESHYEKGMRTALTVK